MRTPAKTTKSTSTTVTKRGRYGAPSKKKTGWRANPVIVNIGRNPIPKQYFATLKYTTVITINTTVGFGSSNIRCNGMFDPEQTGAGHQPLYFDQIMAMYDHFTVLKSKIKAVLAPPSTITNGVLFSMYIDDDTSTTSDAVLAAERIEAVSKFGIPANGNCDFTLWLDWDAVKTFGPNPQANDNLQGTASADPTEQQIFSMKVYDPGLGSTTNQCFVTVEYYAVFDEFVTVANS